MSIPVHYLVVKQNRGHPSYSNVRTAHERAVTGAEDSAEDVGVYKLVGYYGVEVEAIKQEVKG